MSDGVRIVSKWCQEFVKMVSVGVIWCKKWTRWYQECVRKVSDGEGKVSDGVRKVSNVGGEKCHMFMGHCRPNLQIVLIKKMDF